MYTAIDFRTHIASIIPDQSLTSSASFYHSFGRSLLIDFTLDNYTSDAVLIGLDSSVYDETRLKNDLITTSLIFDCSGAVCIVFDVDNLSCSVLEYDKYSHDSDGISSDVVVRQALGSQKISTMLQSLQGNFILCLY